MSSWPEPPYSTSTWPALSFRSRARLSLQEPDGLDALAEKHEAVGGVVGVPLQLAAGAQFFEQLLVLGEIGGRDGFDRGHQFLKRRAIVRGFRRSVGFQLLQAGGRGLQASRRAGEQRFLQDRAEQKLAGALRAVQAAELQSGQDLVGALLFGRGVARELQYAPLLHAPGDLVLDVLLEPAHEQALDVVLAVVVRVGDGRGVQHVHEARERCRLAVVRRRGGHDQGVGLAGEQFGEFGAQRSAAAADRHVVRLVDDDHVPVALFEMDAVVACWPSGCRWR